MVFLEIDLSVISYGKERPVNSGSNPLAWSQNRRSVTVKAINIKLKHLKKDPQIKFVGLFFALFFLKVKIRIMNKIFFY